MTRRVGIEIEAESSSMTMDGILRLREAGALNFWELDTNERSLRAGEYGWEIKTCGRGLPFELVPDAMREVRRVLPGSTGVWRAGVHTHVDVRDMTWPQRALALALAYTVDAGMFESVSPERVESNFCVPLERKSHLVLAAIHNMARGDRPYLYGKYSSVNINCMVDLGTMEFRHMRTPAVAEDGCNLDACLESILLFVSRAHDVIDAAAQFHVSDCRDVMAAYTDLIQDKGFATRIGLRQSQEAIVAVLTTLAHHKLTRTVS